jgi:hypothetical protein
MVLELALVETWKEGFGTSSSMGALLSEISSAASHALSELACREGLLGPGLSGTSSEALLVRMEETSEANGRGAVRLEGSYAVLGLLVLSL